MLYNTPSVFILFSKDRFSEPFICELFGIIFKGFETINKNKYSYYSVKIDKINKKIYALGDESYNLLLIQNEYTNIPVIHFEKEILPFVE